MGMPEQNVAQMPTVGNGGFVVGPQRQECPKYNWQKMTAYERLGVNLMDAVGAQNAVISGAFGILIFAIIMFFFRKQMIEAGSKCIEGFTKKPEAPK